MHLLKYLLFVILFGCNKNHNKNTSVESISTIKRKKKISISKENVKILETNYNETEKIVIPSDVLDSSIKIAELISDIEFTLLETTDKCLIGKINEIFYDSNFYFIHDKRNNKLLRFNDGGKFLNSIGTIGRGPQEILSIEDVAIDKEKKFVSILDSKLKKICRYTYSGEFIEAQPLFYALSQHEYVNNSMVFYVNKLQKNINIPAINSYSLLLANNNSIPYRIGFKNPKNSFSNSTIRPLRRFNNNIYYHHPFSNEIWKIKDSLLLPFVKFKYEKSGLPNDIWKKSISNKEFKNMQDSHMSFSGNYIILENFYYFQIFGKDNKVALLFYNKNSKSLKYATKLEVDKENPLEFLFSFPIGCKSDSLFITSKEAMQVHNTKQYLLKNEKLKNSLKKSDWQKINKIEETDNPVIVTYKLKDF